MVRTINGPHLITTTASMTVCQRCRHMVMAATIGGLDRHVDPIPLNERGELQALINRVPTFELHNELLVHRTEMHIRKGVGNLGVAVVPQHTCRDIPDLFVDHSQLTRAVELCKRSLGAIEVEQSDIPPF